MGVSSFVIGQAEQGRIADPLLRGAVRAIVGSRLRRERKKSPSARRDLWAEAWNGPIALVPDLANEQHYEVPAEFFEIVLGPHLKYSCSLWDEGGGDLEAAEERMLEAYAERAELADGQAILDLGCGWGSFSLWAAARYPNSRITAVSNSKPQRLHIEETAFERGIENLEVVTADINDFDPGDTFDRIISIEMMEHVRNHRALFERMVDWVEEDGAVFIHVFAHREYAYLYETGGATDWMARTFFTGGVMPSRSLIPEAAGPYFAHEMAWWVDGTHYERTCNEWLTRLDQNEVAMRDVLAPVYGDDLDGWIQRWRMFFMACAELFGYDRGREWGVSHHLLRPHAGTTREAGFVQGA
ncbi:MAG: cyclopropane-fatty-acyl-phospholipid synthase family protein [Acidimicrobiia bacterium]|jgi:cyclopropane-fatty-acyl-phospholipid synthase